MKILLGATASAVLLAAVMGFASVGPAAALTNKECDAQWHSDPKGKDAGMKFKDYKAANCEAAMAAPAATPTPAPAVAPVATPTMAPKAAAPAPTPTPTMAPAKGAPAMTANEYATEADAKAKCGADTVVWVNTGTHKWHYAGHPKYGHTKKGAYMCEKEASAAGNVGAKNETAPK